MDEHCSDGRRTLASSSFVAHYCTFSDDWLIQSRRTKQFGPYVHKLRTASHIMCCTELCTEHEITFPFFLARLLLLSWPAFPISKRKKSVRNLLPIPKRVDPLEHLLAFVPSYWRRIVSTYLVQNFRPTASLTITLYSQTQDGRDASSPNVMVCENRARYATGVG